MEIEYIPSALPPEQVASLPQPDWVSAVSIKRKGCASVTHVSFDSHHPLIYTFSLILTGSYDTNVRVFNESQEVVSTISGHTGPVTSISWIPTPSLGDSHLVASASYDTTARITSISEALPVPLASLHLHSAALSSISSNLSGTHLLTASWDKLVGLWTTQTPSDDEVPASTFLTTEPQRKRRKLAGTEAPVDLAKRKGPTSVLKSHTGRVSKALFSPEDNGKAFSVGWDCTLRTWDLEIGLCTNTTVSGLKRMLLVPT